MLKVINVYGMNNNDNNNNNNNDRSNKVILMIILMIIIMISIVIYTNQQKMYDLTNLSFLSLLSFKNGRNLHIFICHELYQVNNRKITFPT